MSAPLKPAGERQAYLDVLRVAAAYCVILLHCLGDVIVRGEIFGTRTWLVADGLEMISRMGVPLFFMMSGYLLLSSEKTLDFIPFYKRRLGRVILPFLVWDVIYYLAGCYTGGMVPSLLRFVRELVQRGSASHLWYVYQIVPMYLLAPFLKRIVDRCTLGQTAWLTLLVALPRVIFGTLNLLQHTIAFNFMDPVLETYFAFFLLGYVLGKWEPGKKTRIVVYILGLFALVLGAVWNYHSSAPGAMELYGNHGYGINHFFSAGAFFLLVRQCFSGRKNWLVRLCGVLAPATYGIYLSHVLILRAVNHYLTHGLHTAGKVAAAFVATTLCATAVSLVLSKIKYARRALT